MKVLVACEFSGRVREAFREKGHSVFSYDIIPSEDGSPYHIQADVRLQLGGVTPNAQRWDLMIAHPPCTRLCNSGVRWLAERDLWAEMKRAADFFRLFQEAKIPKICIENPIPHKYARDIIGRYDQIIQPWMFGHGETKATCLWLKGLSKLNPTNIVNGREARIWKLGPSENRAKERGRTFQGIADAMAEQWG